MPVGRGLRKVTEPRGFSYYLALIVDGIQMEKNRARARPNVVPNVYRRDHRDHRDPRTEKRFFWSQRGKSAALSFYLTHIQTTWDTHGFWVCHRPSPPLHSPGQYPQPGWSSLNSPVFTHAKRERRRYHNAPKTLVFVVLKPDEAVRPDNLEVLFELLLFSEFLEVATGLRLLPLLGKLSAGDGRGERTGRANLKILAGQIRWQYCESAEGWESGRNSTAREPAEGRRAKLRWQKRELCQGVRGLVCKCSPENILSGLHLLPFIWLCIETKMLIYLKCPGTARWPRACWGSPRGTDRGGQLWQRCSCQGHLYYWAPWL